MSSNGSGSSVIGSAFMGGFLGFFPGVVAVVLSGILRSGFGMAKGSNTMGYSWTLTWWCLGLSIGIGVFLGLVSGIRAAAANARSVREHARKAAEDEVRSARERRLELAHRVRRDALGASDAYAGLPRLLENAADWHDEARVHFRAKAYSPFWTAIESAFVNLGEYNATILRIHELADTYERDVAALRADGSVEQVEPFSVDPRAAEALVAAEPVASALRTLAYEAQRDAVYAQIWEQRRTTAAVVSGFRNLEQAVGSLAQAVRASSERLSDRVSTGLDTLNRSVTRASDTSRGNLERVGTSVDKAVWLLEDQRKRALSWR